MDKCCQLCTISMTSWLCQKTWRQRAFCVNNVRTANGVCATYQHTKPIPAAAPNQSANRKPEQKFINLAGAYQFFVANQIFRIPVRSKHCMDFQTGTGWVLILVTGDRTENW